MNYLGLISICLGIIAVLVTIQYMKTSDKLYSEIKIIRSKCIAIKQDNPSKIERKIIKLIKDVQYETGLSLKNIKNILIKKELIKNKDVKEGFIPNTPYMRPNTNITKKSYNKHIQKYLRGNINSDTINNAFLDTDELYSTTKYRGYEYRDNYNPYLNYEKINKLSDMMSGYQDLFKRTFERVLWQDKQNKDSLLPTDINKLFKTVG